MNTSAPHPFIKWFADTTIADIPLVGGKNASLGGMVCELAAKGVKVPDGFGVTPDEYKVFKTTLNTAHRRILQKTVGSKEFKLIYEPTSMRRSTDSSVAKTDWKFDVGGLFP